MSETFHDALCAVASENNVKQADLHRSLDARGIQVTTSAIAQWFQGRTTPRAPVAAVLIELLAANDEQRTRLLRALGSQAA